MTTASETSTAPARARHTFLIVDDEPDVLAALERLFADDYDVLLANSATAALELLDKHSVQIVMSDQRMPEMSGVDFLTQVRERFPSAVRILITGYSDMSSVVEAINQGHIYSYVSKPWRSESLRTTVRLASDHYDLSAERRRLLRDLQISNRALEQRNSELALANAELKELDRLKNVFMELVSHELNTPIAIILGYTFLLEKELKLDPSSTGARALRGIGSSGQRLRNITSKVFRVLSTSATSIALDYEDVQISALVDEIARIVSPFLDKRGQSLQVDCPTALVARIDRNQIADALVNLVMNAIKFSDDGQVIQLLARLEDDARTLLLRVSDEGVGISNEDQPRIFESFFGTFNSKHHSSGEFEFKKRGIGLGLTMVRRFAELHGGQVEVESSEGEGTTFSLRIPISPDAAGLE